MAGFWSEQSELWILASIHFSFQYSNKAKRMLYDDEAYDIFRIVQEEFRFESDRILKNMSRIRVFYDEIGFTLAHHIWADDLDSEQEY